MNAANLHELEPFLKQRIRGQDFILPTVAERLRHAGFGLTDADQPLASFLFLGPTGTGKTELTRLFTRFLFNAADDPSDRHLGRIDMSEYKTTGCIERFITRIGQIFRETGGQGTLLADEIEKAHPEVLDVFLQILDAARLTLLDGTVLDFSRYFIVWTSNLGAGKIMQLAKSPYATMKRIVEAEALQSLRPEIFARLTEVIVFQRLDYPTQCAIAHDMLHREVALQQSKGHAVALPPDSPAVLDLVIRKGFHRTLGARPMRKAIQRLVRNAVTTRLIAAPGQCEGTFEVSAGDPDALEILRPEAAGAVPLLLTADAAR